MIDPTLYLNKKDALRNLSDEEFEVLVPKLAQALEDSGFMYDASTEEDIKKDWTALLKKTTSSVPNSQGVIVVPATSTIGMKVIRRYMPHFYAVKNYRGVSVLSLWTKQHIEKALRFNRKYHSTPYVSEIIRSLSFTNGLGKITIYRPLITKTIVSYFGAKSVLDVCVGWGGRMLGSIAAGSDVTYTGIETCLATYNGLCNIRDAVLSTTDQPRVTLIRAPAEYALQNLPPDQTFDLALTSPPYFNLELYDESTSETGQSMQYQTYNAWVTYFLEPIIVGVIQRVKYSCWSVKNFKTDKKYNLLNDVIAIHEKNGWHMMDACFSVKNSSRPGNSGSTDSAGSEEMTYVFIKVEGNLGSLLT